MDLDRLPPREPSPPGERESPPERDDLRRWLVAPWTLLVFLPLVVVTTVFWGILAIALAALSKKLAFHCGVVWARCLCWASFVRVRVAGRERAPAGTSYVFLANHQGDYDILALYGFLGRQFRWVMKQELRKVPFLGWGCAAIGHIFVDRSNPRAAIASLDAAKPRLAGGVSVLFFPEGTRSPDGRLLPFKKGGFQMARQLGLPIVPVTISGSLRALPKGSIFPRPGTIRIEIHEPIPAAEVQDLDRAMATARARIEAGLTAEPDRARSGGG